MKQYILKLKTTSTTNYALYDGTTALTDAQLTTLFTTAGSAYFTFDFDSLTPSATNAITIVDSSDTAVVTNTNLTDTIVETKDFKGTWSASATAFDTFVALSGVAMDEAQLSDLMGKIKEAKEIRTVTFSSYYLNMWDKTTYPDGIYRVEYTGSGYGTVTLSDSGSGIAVTNNQNIKGGSYVLLGTVGNYGYRYMIGVSTRLSGDGAYGENGLGCINAIFSQNGNVTSKRFDGIVINGLTSTATTAPLSANQGRVLNNYIGTLSNLTTTAKTSAVVAINEVNAKVLTNAGAPTTSTVGTVGQLLADTTNGKLYICTDATNPYVWEEIGAGGGGIQNALIIREWS